MFRTLSIFALLALAASQSVHAQDRFITEPVDVAVTKYNTALVAAALKSRSNLAETVSRPICVKSVFQVREATVNATKEFYFSVNGCGVDQPQGFCTKSTCATAPFEVLVAGPASTPNYNPITAAATGVPAKSPFTVYAISSLR